MLTDNVEFKSKFWISLLNKVCIRYIAGVWFISAYVFVKTLAKPFSSNLQNLPLCINWERVWRSKKIRSINKFSRDSSQNASSSQNSQILLLRDHKLFSNLHSFRNGLVLLLRQWWSFTEVSKWVGYCSKWWYVFI